MSNEIDWSKAPRGADKIVENPSNCNLYWAGHKGVLILGNWVLDRGGYRTIATRPAYSERKTVKDAVEHYGGEWPVSKYPGDEFNYIYMKDDGSLIPLRGNHHGSSALVCTREEFEAEVERQKEGQEWTYTHGGQKCVVVAEKPGYSWIRIRGSIGPGLIVPSDTVHPIPQKTKITQEQADSIIAAAAAWGVDADDCQDYLLNFSVTGHDESLEF